MNTSVLDMPLHAVFTLFIIELNGIEDTPGIVSSTKELFGVDTTIQDVDSLLKALSEKELITETTLYKKHYKLGSSGKETLRILHSAFECYSAACKHARAQQLNKIRE